MGDWAVVIDLALRDFAQRLRERLGAHHVLLFGSRARGDAHEHSDYDLFGVSPRVAETAPLRRSIGLRQLWYESGGAGPMHLVCLTPKEFSRARQEISLVSAILPESVNLLS